LQELHNLDLPITSTILSINQSTILRLCCPNYMVVSKLSYPQKMLGYEIVQ